MLKNSNQLLDAGTYRIFGALRLLLAIVVVISHSRMLGGDSIAQALKPWGIGNIGVMGFFILSGFIISEALQVFYQNKTKAFLINRLMRLIPPYLAALVFSIILHLLIIKYSEPKYFDYTSTPEGVFSLKNLFANFILPIIWYGLDTIALEPIYPFVRYVWAVSVEWWFYVAMAICMLLWSRFKLVWIAFCLALSSSYLYKITGFIWLYPLTFAPYFLTGVCLYFYLKNRTWLPLLGFAISLTFGVSHFYIYAGQTIQAIIGGGVVVLIAVLIIPLSLIQSPPRWLRSLDRQLGDLSYPVYLNHYVITILFLSVLGQRSVLTILACVIMTLASSWMLTKLVEPLTREFRDRLRGARLG